VHSGDFNLQFALMLATTESHKGHEYTGRLMHALARNYSSDLGAMLYWPWPVYWDFVRKIPYQDDPTLFLNPEREIVSRPKYMISGYFPALDCKKKSILLASHAWANRLPYKFLAGIENGGAEIHHVFPVVFDGRAWVNADATLPSNRYGEAKPFLTYAEELAP